MTELAKHLGFDNSFFFFQGNWTLLHVCAKFRFAHLAEYLLQKPGAAEALSVVSEGGLTPCDIAKQTEDETLMDLFSR